MKKKLLFVDDDINILQGLKRMLRPYHKEWQVAIAESGQQALDILGESEFDCIISDMRMPGMDGATLLTKVYEKYPHVTRFILSGHADSEPIMQAVPVTHQYLAKPCDPEELVSIIKRACDLHNLIEDDNLKAIIGKVDILPSRPDVYANLSSTLSDDNASMEDVAEIIEKDIAITAKILQVVNSAFFGLAQNISNIRDAVAYLGLNTVKGLVLSEEVHRTFNKISNIPGFSLDQEYRNANLSGHIAKKLLKNRSQADDAFMAGVLHRIGRLVIAQYSPDKLKIVLAEEKTQDKPLVEIEKAHIGAPMSYIGAYLLGLWGLPYPVIEAVAHYHTPWNVPHETFQVLDALYVANRLIADMETADQQADSTINLDYLEQLGVADHLPQWQTIAAEQMSLGAEE